MKSLGAHLLSRRPRVLGTVLVVLTTMACSGSPTGTGQPKNSTPQGPTQGSTATSAPGPTGPATAGAWQGTITFHAVMNDVKDGTSDSGDPGTVFHITTTTHDVMQADVTDAFTVTGNDPEDLTYGIDSVDLGGTVANQGTDLERHVGIDDKYNALNCHYTDEVGQELSGSWSHQANAAGTIRFFDDGTYSITINEAGDPQTGEEFPTPQLPKRLWETFTILAGAAKDCPPPGGETNTTDGPVVEWASSYTSGTDANGNSVEVGGQLDLNNPGSVVDGSISFDVTLPKLKMTVTWHLVHTGPIVLPHS